MSRDTAASIASQAPSVFLKNKRELVRVLCCAVLCAELQVLSSSLTAEQIEQQTAALQTQVSPAQPDLLHWADTRSCLVVIFSRDHAAH